MSALQVALKEEGNDAFAKGHWKEAIDSYTEAIALKGDEEVLAILYSNRSAAYMKSGKYQAVRKGAMRAFLNVCLHSLNILLLLYLTSQALADAKTTVKLAPNWQKGRKRLAHACELTGDITGAMKATRGSGNVMGDDDVRLLKKSVD